MSTIKVNTVQDVSGGQKATLKAGTACVQNPVGAINTKTTQAHGLGSVPSIVMFYVECITAELGYSVGDRALLWSSDAGTNTGAFCMWDGTNTYIVALSDVYVPNKTTPAGPVIITNANWKLVAVPYLLN